MFVGRRLTAADDAGEVDVIDMVVINMIVLG
jgi:hypothetical protein